MEIDLNSRSFISRNREMRLQSRKNFSTCIGSSFYYRKLTYHCLLAYFACRVSFAKTNIHKPEKEIARMKSGLDKTMKKVTEASKLVSEELDGKYCITYHYPKGISCIAIIIVLLTFVI